MAAVTPAVSTPSSSNTTSYASGTFTPAANDLLVAFVFASGTVAAAPTLIGSGGLAFTRLSSGVAFGAANIHRLYFFTANALAANSLQSVTFDCTGDPADGATISVARVSGMTKTGNTGAVRQSKEAPGVAGATTPAPTFDLAALTGNPTLGAVAKTSAVDLTPPTLWTEGAETSYTTPAITGEYCYRDSGFTGTTITWGSSVSSIHGDLIVELDASAPVAGIPDLNMAPPRL